MPRVTLIDNYDSFTWNLVHLIENAGATTQVVRNDSARVDAILDAAPEAIVLSPGPCTPNEAGICLDLIKAAEGRVPLLGVCLGHQAIGAAYGGEVVRAPLPVHGKIAAITHRGEAFFKVLTGRSRRRVTIPSSCAARTLPDDLTITAEADGLVMGLSHRMFPTHGVQFHPESIASEHGATIIANFLTLAMTWTTRRSG